MSARAKVLGTEILGLERQLIVRPATRFVYDRFADLLYAWNRRCGRW